MKLLYLALRNLGVHWKPAIEWRAAYAQFTIFFPDRLPTTIRFNHGADAVRAYQLPIPGLAHQLHEQEVPVARHGYMTNLLGDRAVQTVESYGKSREPFLLSLHFTAPHWPWEGPDDEAESRRIQSILHRDGGTRRTYAAMVQSLDANVGRVLQALDLTGLANNTIVVFTSDNGGERFSNTWPFSGMKHEPLEGGLRIPAIARWPGRIAAGSVSDQIMATMDWLPTLLAAAGTSPDPAYRSDGQGLESVMADGAASHPRKLYWRYKAGSQRAVRDGNWKYLRIAGNEFLFDVVQDLRERANLKDREKGVFDRLMADWEACNATMLPERARPSNYAHPGQFYGRSLRRGEPGARGPVRQSADEMKAGVANNVCGQDRRQFAMLTGHGRFPDWGGIGFSCTCYSGHGLWPRETNRANSVAG